MINKSANVIIIRYVKTIYKPDRLTRLCTSRRFVCIEEQKISKSSKFLKQKYQTEHGDCNPKH